MSQNGPYGARSRPGGDGAEPQYAQPSDPWGDHAAAVPPSPLWSGSQQGAPDGPPPEPGWAAPRGDTPSRPSRNAAMIALVLTLGVLVAVGIGVAGWLLQGAGDKDDKSAQGSPAASTGAASRAATNGGSNAGFTVKEGECLTVVETPQPTARHAVCARGTYKVLKRINGKTTGDQDATRKCAGLEGFSDFFFFDSPLDDLDYVLCLHKVD